MPPGLLSTLRLNVADIKDKRMEEDRTKSSAPIKCILWPSFLNSLLTPYTTINSGIAKADMPIIISKASDI
jgi:hypothetical protein